MYHPVFRTGVQRQLKQLGEADLVVGLPTFQNPAEAVHVAQTALAGLQQHYPHLRTVLLNADAGQAATTRQAVAALSPETSPASAVITGRYEGLLGQGSAVAALLDAALSLDAKAIVILDSQTRTLTPDWVAGLAHLILQNKADLVVARYRWPLPAGSESDLILYPLFRALWGQSLRYPTSPDFALSPRLATAVLDQDVWETGVALDGLSPWLTTFAILHHWRVAQAALGEKQPFSPSSDPASRQAVRRQQTRLKTKFHHLLSVALRLVYDYRHHWDEVDTIDSLATLTRFAPAVSVEPFQHDPLDPVALLDELVIGWTEYRALWQKILTPENLATIESLAALPFERFYFPCDLWARIIYDFCTVFNKGEGDPDQVINALWPLYRGRLAAFWQEVAGLSLVGFEGTVAAQAVEFEETRPYLKKRWRAYQPV